jgi:hypothetical protein
MKKLLTIVLLTLVCWAGVSLAQTPDAGWEVFVVREGVSGPPLILPNAIPGAIEVVTFESGQKAALGTNLINGATVEQIATLHIDRLDDIENSGALYSPYFNIWVTDGLGNYAVVANEPSNPEWAANRWDVADWNYLKTKTCKIYETINASAGTSWAHAYATLNGWSGVLNELTFEHVGGLTISPPPPAYIQAGNGVGSGAPDVLGTDVAYGYNWVFGDTQANYVSGDPGVLVDNYSATASFPVNNVTQGLGYGTIGAALAAAAPGDDITVDDGAYAENITIPVGVTLRSLNGAAVTTIAGSGGAVVVIDTDNVTIDGFTITNPTGTYAITATDHSNLAIRNNVITNIGSSAVSAYVHSVAIVCSASPVANVVIEDNEFSYIEAGEYSSASAIAVGWSNGAEAVTGLVIQNNSIFHVRSNTSPWNVGHGAYGIILNHGTGTTGQTVGAQILNNTIDDLEGLWAHGIGLEGNTPFALVEGNTISNLVDHKAPSDAVAVMVESNASLGTVTVVDNTFTNVNVGIANVVAGPDFVNAVNNDWGDVSGPFNPYQNPNGTGAAVYGAVTYAPWTGRMTSLVADLGIDPVSKVITVDGYGIWDGTPALGLDDDFVAGFAPGAFQSNITASDPAKYTKYGFAPIAVFGRDIHVGELLRVSYFTKKGTDHVASPPDWFCQLYTNGTAHGWYGERIHAEPYYSENLTETPGEWTEWVSDPGQNNRLRFYDGNLSLGSYTDGFLPDMTYDLNYADQTIMVMGLATGTPWAETFDGKVDGLTIELVSGEIATFNFISGNNFIEATPSVSGPSACGDTVTVTFNLETDQYTPPVFGFNAVVRATSEVEFGPITSLAAFGGTTYFYTIDKGDGSWDISGTTIGSPSEPIVTPGTHGLFTIKFVPAGDGVADITFDLIKLRDPDNVPIPAVGTGATITVDCTAPAAVTGITAAPGHNKVNVGWTHDLTDVDHFEVFSGVWHDGANNSAYPEYDDLVGNTIPTPPTAYPGPLGTAEWLPLPQVAVTTQTQTWADHLSRGVYYYTVFAVDAAGNVSAAPAAVDRATNYWLGDVAGVGGGDPNGLVQSYDMDALGAAFGKADGQGGYNNIIDVGPTDDWSRLGIPLTDSVIDFEDLIVFTMNFGVVGPAKATTPISPVVQLAWVRYDDGRQALRLVDGTGVKGLNVRADVPVHGVAAGQLLDDQAELTFLRNVGENLDVSVAITGVNVGFAGTGDLFIVDAGSEISLDDLTIKVRGYDNSKLEYRMDETAGTLTPRVFSLNANYPNPFNPMTKISFSLPEAQTVRLAVYGVDGRKVATLLDEVRGPGLHEVVWTGQDDRGQQAASGLYFYRIDAGPYSQVRKMTLMK